MKSGRNAVRSSVAKVTVLPLPAISGPSTVCYSGSTFTLNNPPPGIITWSVTGSFTVTGTGGGILTASVNGMVFTKPVTPCPPPVITGSSYVCDYQVWYSVSNLPSGVSYSQVKWTCRSNLQPYDGNYGVSKLFYVTGKGADWVKAEITSHQRSFTDE